MLPSRGSAAVVVCLALASCAPAAQSSSASRGPSSGDEQAGGDVGRPPSPGTSGAPEGSPTDPTGDPDEPAGGPHAGVPDAGRARDAGGSAAAAIVELSTFTSLYAVSDIHGHYAQLIALLIQHKLIASAPAQPSGIVWTGGDATLVVTGDMIDKGPRSLGVLEAMMALEAAAAAKGGRVIALLGNHEAEFLGDPKATKFQGAGRIDDELAAQTPSVDPAAFAGGADPRGAWLRRLPFGAKVGSWFFAHAGDTAGATIAALDAQLGAARARANGWLDPAIVGPTSILESRDWYTSVALVQKNEAALGVKHIAFGHTPGAFGATGAIIAPSEFGGALVKLDTGLGNDVGSGALLRVRHAGAVDVAEALRADGTAVVVWTGAP
jgi:hypothetical protein